MMKTTITLLFLLAWNFSFACTCAGRTLSERFESSSFIGVVKITGIKNDNSPDRSRNIFSIVVLTSYKGILPTEIYGVADGCSFYGSINSTWLIFTYTSADGKQETNYCSGNIDFNREIDTIQYPGLREKMATRLKVKLGVLDFLKKQNITTLNPDGLYYGSAISKDSTLQGFVETNAFAIYEATIEKDLSISKLKVLKPFKNLVLSKNLNRFLKDRNLNYRRKNDPPLRKQSKVVMIFYYYQSEKDDLSFISTNDL